MIIWQLPNLNRRVGKEIKFTKREIIIGLLPLIIIFND